MSDRPQTPLLDTVNVPPDLRSLSKEQLPQLADELRQEVISAVSVTGGHLGSALGVIELTVALHYVFDTPNDKLIWDVGHQAYPHKIVTGRRDRIRTLRQGGGLSGFTRRAESEYDPFGAAHSSTSISAALGFAIASKLSDSPGKAIAVIGDGALSAGMGYAPAENAADKYHGVVKFDVISGVQAKPAAGAPSYTSVFAKALAGEMARDEKVVAITAAMPSGTGLDKVAEAFPKRVFDVGI